MAPLIPPEDWQPVGVATLEPNAERVVRSDTNCLVVAGPGAGKTELLAQRANFLLNTGICPPPKRILAISFKRDAAKNLERRVKGRCAHEGRRFDSLTLDAFAKHLVDRFLQALPKEWRPAPSYEVNLSSPRPEAAEHWLMNAPLPQGESPPTLQGWGNTKIKKTFDLVMHGYELPYEAKRINVFHQVWGIEWWREQLDAPAGQPSLTFPMLNRLAAFLLRINPKILKALQFTYPFVFLDEFQDTTASQWDLVRSAFLNSTSVLTAVGDSKQRIMLWAGAKEDVFDIYQADFMSDRVELVSNYRSVPELVTMQHIIAQAVEADTKEPICACTKEGTGACSVLELMNPEQEAVYLAQLIQSELAAGQLKPRDFCIMARQRTGDMIALLQEELKKGRIVLRDESRLQDLMVEPLTEIVVSSLRLATTPRSPDAWDYLTEEMASLSGLDKERDGAELDKLVIAHKQAVAAEIDKSGKLSELPNIVVNVLGPNYYKSNYRQYTRGEYFSTIVKRLGEELQSSLDSVVDVTKVADDFLGENSIPAMTIHKSKGLEFHTVIFMGLEDSQWWSFRNQPEEEIRAFFVAFSRATHRVFFTFSGQRDAPWGRQSQTRNNIGALHSILQQCGALIHDLRTG